MRLAGAGRRETAAELNDAVLKWIEEARANHRRVSRKLIKLQATNISVEMVKAGKLKEGAFVASEGWLQKFMTRNGLSLRRVTSQCQKPPAIVAPALVKFVMFIRSSKRLERKYPYGHVFAADETAVWIDPAGVVFLIGDYYRLGTLI